MKDEKGIEVLKARTSSQGVFDLQADPGKKYSLEPGSRFYVRIFPQGMIRAGEKIDLQLRLR